MSGKKIFFLVLVVFVTIVLAVFFCIRRASKQRKLPNVIFVVIDALRPDHLGCYGYSRDTSPNIDEFAQEGVLFENAFSSATRTLISVPSTLTSLYPETHGVLKLGDSLHDFFPGLPDTLSKFGYRTAAFVGPHLRAIVGLPKRFQTFESLGQKEYSLDPDFPIGGQGITEAIIDKAERWIAKESGSPFFLYIHFLRVHSPYCSVPADRHYFWKDEITEDMLFLAKTFCNIESDVFSHDNPGEDKRTLDFIISQYDSDIHYVDSKLGDFFSWLKISGLNDNTLVIFMSDHGEELNDRGYFFHGSRLYDELIRTSLIMRLPKVLPSGKRVRNTVRLIDLMPTVLDILGIDAGIKMQGTSLSSIIKGRNLFAEPSLFSETTEGSLKAIRKGHWKLIVNDDSSDGDPMELYDIHNDPGERSNVIDKYPRKAGQLLAELNNIVKKSHKLRQEYLKVKPDEGGQDEELSQGDRELLKELGYVQ